MRNWSWMPSDFKLPGGARDVFYGESFGYGDVLEVGPWDVRVLREVDVAG